MTLTIELTPAEYQPFLVRAAQEISTQTKIPGFRPGKATYEQIKQRVGENEIWQAALEPAVRKTLVQAVTQEQLHTVGSPQIAVEKLAPGNPVVYTAQLSLLPDVRLADLSKMHLKKNEAAVTPEQVDQALAELRTMRQTQVLVDRAAANGDRVEVSFIMVVDNVPLEDGQQKLPITLGEKKFLSGFEEQLVGMKTSEKKQFDLKIPADHFQKTIAGKTVTFKTTVEGVYQVTQPELNDSFAQSLGSFNTLDQLRTAMQQNLKTEAEHEEDGRQENELFDLLIEKSTFGEIPDLLINAEAKKMLAELEQHLKTQGIAVDDYLLHLKKTRDELLLDFTPQAIKRVKSALLIRAVAQDKQIIASADEIDEEIERARERYAHNAEVLKQLTSDEYREYLQNAITSRKVVEHLKDLIVK